MDLHDVGAAKKALRNREGITGKNWASRIGAWQADEPNPPAIPSIAHWARALGLDVVIWTALGPKFDSVDRWPAEDEVIAHLRELRGSARDNAEQYIRRTPPQIDTPYRRRIEREFGWRYAP